MPSIIVSKPRVAFSERLKDPSLHRLTVTQLRKKARERHLDLHRLTEKWEFVHVLLTPKEQIVGNIYGTEGLTFFDLPGEIRNKIYGYVLVGEGALVADYPGPVFSPSGTDTSIVISTLHESIVRLNSLISLLSNSFFVHELLAISLASRQLRKEARAFFFANNHFRVDGTAGATYLSFLEDIGADGRMNISKLNFSSSEVFHQDAAFKHLLGACVNLRELKIRLHIGNIVDRKTYMALQHYTRFSVELDLEIAIFGVLSSSMLHIFNLLPSLRKLLVVVAVPYWNVSLPWFLLQSAMGREHGLYPVIKEAVEERLVQVLEHTRLEVNVEVKKGAPELP